jgi:hypothetical protein
MRASFLFHPAAEAGFTSWSSAWASIGCGMLQRSRRHLSLNSGNVLFSLSLLVDVPLHLGLQLRMLFSDTSCSVLQYRHVVLRGRQ